MAIREGKWKCPSCSTVNRGAQTQCGQCGTTRDANVKFFLDDDAAEVTDAAQLAAAKAGADWICEFCGNTSPQSAPNCTGCAAPKSAKQRKAGDVIPVPGSAPAAEPVAAAPAPQAASCGPVGLAIGVLLLGLCVVLGYFHFRTQHEVATVTGAHWQRTLEVEDFVAVQESAWDRPPEGARDSSHKTEQKTTRSVQHGMKTVMVDEKVQTGTKKTKTGDKDLGNGHFEEQFKEEPIFETKKVSKEVPNMVDEPVFAEKYYFTIDRWKVVRTPVAKGTATDPPKWPDTQLKGKERKGKETELYLVTVKGQKGEIVLKAPNLAEWEKFKPSSTWKAEFNNAGEYKLLGDDGKPLPLEKTDEKIN